MPSPRRVRRAARWVAPSLSRPPSPKPQRTTANPRKAVPPSETRGRNTPSGCPKATFPHGNPPKGMRERNASPATHNAAAHRGAAGSRDTRAIPAPASPTNSACRSASTTHARTPTSTYSPIQVSRGRKKPSPKTRPYPAPARAVRPDTTAKRTAKAIGASHHRSRGGNPAYQTAPAPATASNRATNPGTGDRRSWRGERPGTSGASRASDTTRTAYGREAAGRRGGRSGAGGPAPAGHFFFFFSLGFLISLPPMKE
ncbi:hypothetical protein G443_000342 [Actinoalloteichus cyanogriseus DSM 43889]|uniref:Uncharacterized protein n=1 Tax=Actinoalloteichus caeruleus DSM 43889 TaxID=1120930 RepID=A0ABT1JC49_ACTCY|nr:hypothetical protein [Actinoalloteichus caeruleus DSM 43889]